MRLPEPLRLVEVESARLACAVLGRAGAPVVLVETALAACSAEWWHLAQAWSAELPARVVVYDRAGYGHSSRSRRARRPVDVTAEAFTMLDRLDLTGPLVVVGHGLGGLYAQHHARAHPERVRGLVLLDPVTASHGRLARELTPAELAAGGVDRRDVLARGRRLCGLGLGLALRPMLAKLPPLSLRVAGADLSEPARAYILGHGTHAAAYRAALDELAFLDDDAALRALGDRAGFPAVPLELVTSSPDAIIDEAVRAGADRATAEKLERLWHETMRGCLELTPHARATASAAGDHHLHLTAPDDVTAALRRVLDA